MLLGRVLVAVVASSPPAAATLVDHPMESGAMALYLDGAWSAFSSATTQSINASVPGDILTDLQRAGVVPDPYFNSTWNEPSFVAAWNLGTWTYRKSFESPVAASGAAALLVFDGIRMGAMISLNGHPLGNASDQFLRYDFPVGQLLKPRGQQNELVVVFGAELGIDCQGRWTRSNEIDWAPRMPTTDPFTKRSTFGFGIWKSVYLLPVPKGSAAITQLISHTFYAGGHPTSLLTDNTHKGFIVNVTVELWGASSQSTSGTLRVLGSWPGAAPVSTNVLAGSVRATVTLPASQTLGARLWQPNGHGEQVRYNLTATFTPSSSMLFSSTMPSVATRMIGFRHIAMVTVNDTDPAIVARAASQDGTGSLTMMFRVNGAPLYARGGNKIPMELLDGRMTAVAHRRLVQSAAEGNFNMLRIWGGAIFEPRAFYDAADEFGILLYHDMQFAGGSSLTSPQVKSELEYQVKRLSHHPSVAMWDGCNECGGMGDYMNFVMPTVASVDSSRPIWPSCPAPGWVTGVDRLSARPNGKKLLTGLGGTNQSIGEGRPSGYPFPNEGHGPYTAFMGCHHPPCPNGVAMNMDDTVMPGHHAETGCEGEVNHPTLVPAHVGQGEEGWYRSEFGCVAWSSFESMSGEMPPDQWGMLTPGAKNRNWNPANVITKFFGLGAEMAMGESGEVAFKRQLYQSMVGQLLFLKTEIEAWRSQNVWGTTFWMYNEIWPTGGWGSIEYGSPVPGQVEGGRWKPLHYMLKSSTFADQMSTCNDAGACIVKNDSPFRFSGKASVRLLNVMTSTSVLLTEHSLSMAAGAGVDDWYCGTGSSAASIMRQADEIKATPSHNPKYTLHVGQIPVNRNNYTNPQYAGEAKCETECNADKSCVGFTYIGWPADPLKGTCYLYDAPHKLMDYAGADWFQKPGTTPIPAPPVPPPPPPPPPPSKKPPPQLTCPNWADAKGWKNAGCDTNGTNCVLIIDVTNNTGARVSHNVLPFVPPKRMMVPQADVAADIKLIDGRPTVELTTNSTALWVVLTTKAAGRFAEGAFLLEKPGRNIAFEPWDDASDAASVAMVELKQSLRVEHLAQMLPPPTPPPPPIAPCPAVGCAGCGSPPCHWAYENNSCPAPSLPFTSETTNTTVGCEMICAAQGNSCIGFTASGDISGEVNCFFYQQVSGLFSHDQPEVSWHPKPTI